MTQTIILGKINAKRVTEAISSLLWKAKSFNELNSRINHNGEYEESSTVLTDVFGTPDQKVIDFVNSLNEEFKEVNETNFKEYLARITKYQDDYTLKVVDKRRTKEQIQKGDIEREKRIKESNEKKAAEDAAIKAKGLLTESEKISLGTKEIARRIREQLKTEFKNCVFSVRFESYSGGSSITVALMQSAFKVVKDFKDLSEDTINKCCDRNRQSKEQIKQTQEDGYHQLNQHCFREDYNPDDWNNGVFLTKEGYELFKQINNIVNHYNYDHSDPQTDYFDVNFYYHLNIGQWDKPYKIEVA